MRVLTSQQIREGESLPFWYGKAYYDFDRDVRVAYVIPLNWIVWFWHNKLRYWLKMPPRDEEMHRAYLAGYKHGLNGLRMMREHREWLKRKAS